MSIEQLHTKYSDRIENLIDLLDGRSTFSEHDHKRIIEQHLAEDAEQSVAEIQTDALIAKYVELSLCASELKTVVNQLVEYTYVAALTAVLVKTEERGK